MKKNYGDMGVTRTELKFSKTIMIVGLGLLLTVLPKMLITMIDHDVKHPYLYVFGDIFAWMSVFINPLIYFFSNGTYKKAFYNTFRESHELISKSMTELHLKKTEITLET